MKKKHGEKKGRKKSGKTDDALFIAFQVCNNSFITAKFSKG